MSVLLNTNYATDASLVDFGFDSIQGWSLVDLTVSVSADEITMVNHTSASRTMEAKFTNIGKVTPISATVQEVKDLVAGKFTTTNTIKGTSVTFDVEVKKRAEKTARNISKNVTIKIPAHNIPSFKPSKEFTAKVK